MRARRKKIEPSVFGITENWHTSSEITNDPRELKRKVREYNDHFGEDEQHRWYIVSGSFGYKLTRDKDEIIAALAKEEARWKDMRRQANERKKRFYDYFTSNMRLPL